MQQNIKRRRYFLDKGAQGRVVLWFVFFAVLGTVCAVGIFTYLGNLQLEKVAYAMSIPKTTTGALLASEMLFASLCAVLFIALSFGFASRRIFARINGPLVRFAVDFLKIGKGDLRVTVTLRRKDEFQDFAETVNDMVTELNRKISRISRTDRSLVAFLDSNPGVTYGGKSALQELDRLVTDLETELAGFKTGQENGAGLAKEENIKTEQPSMC